MEFNYLLGVVKKALVVNQLKSAESESERLSTSSMTYKLNTNRGGKPDKGGSSRVLRIWGLSRLLVRPAMCRGEKGGSGFRKVATKKQQYQAKYPERAAVPGKEPKNVSSSVSWQRQVSHAWRGGRESGQKEER